ncbi:unnamed protein product [Hymenolepis diminuta]|uniref:Fibronectin type-III domain-containing protein n=1 Tax=Hymenolepis diminuta TaxID=6216 RepID=A0A564XXJ5_HYMDI|nr:unnamed protein product [Hymenolepis diminuta]
MLFLLIVIKDLKVTEVKDTSAKFSWVVNSVSNEWKNTTIYVFPDKNLTTNPVSGCHVTDENAEQTCTAENLFSNTRYSSLCVVFEKSANVSLARIDFQTTPQKPHNLKVSSRTDISISVSWEIPENEVTTSPIRYIVKATGADQECASEESKSCKIMSLTPNTAYDLTIEACSVDNLSLCSEKSGIVKGFTTPAAVQDLQVDNVGSRKAIFSWSDIPNGSGELKNLTVYVFSRGSSKNETVNKCYVIGSNINSMRTCTAMALSPNVQYSATAVICSNDDYGCSVDSNAVDFQTAPPAPVQITAGAIGTKYIEVRWTPALIQGFDGYQVVAIPLSGNPQAKPQTCNAAASEKSCVIRNLQSATRYTITVVAYIKTSDGKTLYGDTILFLNLRTDVETYFRNIIAVFILIPLFILLTFLILFALRNRIPALHRLFNRKLEVDIVPGPMTTISFNDAKALDQQFQLDFLENPQDLPPTSNQVKKFSTELI